MKVSYNWLKEHIELTLSVEELSARLLSLGFEVAGVERKGPQFRGVVTAKVLEVTKHPNADRLRLCTVDDGTTKFSVVCGAPNVAAGQSVALARVGAELPGGKKLAPAKIRGVESQGMLCSSAELGLGGGHEGILVLGESTPLGQDYAASLGPGDTILEVEITPNRPDCLSHRGLARELSAALNIPLKPLSTPPLPSASGECPVLTIEDEKACPTYVGRLITGVKVGPSPAWLAAKLEAIGMKPINNVVDVTNFILHDVGQPLHAFDASRLDSIRVRWARSGESIKALDGKSYPLSDKNLLIASSNQPLAIAGVMGGEESSVTDKTTAIVLESAYFAPPVVRKSSQTLRLKSDSSYRFERGTDPASPAATSERAAGIIAQLGGSGVKVSAARLAGSQPKTPRTIKASAARINAILGSAFAPSDVEGVLGRIGKMAKNGEMLTVEAPSHRGDLETVWDLAEDVARILGYDNVPTASAKIAVEPAELTPAIALERKLRSRLIGLGLTEAFNYDFTSSKLVEQARLDPKACERLANPLSDDWTLLRPTLLIGLLESAAANLRHGAAGARLFELGKQYRPGGESARAAGVLLGPVADRYWQAARTPNAGFYDAKGLVSELLSGLPNLNWTPLKEHPAKLPGDGFFHPGAALRVSAGKKTLGTVGLLHPTLARAWGLDRQDVCLFELDLAALAAVPVEAARFSPYSPFPPAWRDLSVLVDAAKPWAELEAAVRKGAGAALISLELVDVFAGKNVPAGKRSLTLRLTFGSVERTLTDAEVTAAVEQVLAGLKALGAELRA